MTPALDDISGRVPGAGSALDRSALVPQEPEAVDSVYVWADGVHFKVRLGEDRLCCLVIVGVWADGTKELVVVADG